MSIRSTIRNLFCPAINIDAATIPNNSFAALHVNRHLSDDERRQMRVAIDSATAGRGIKTVIFEPGMSMTTVIETQEQSRQ